MKCTNKFIYCLEGNWNKNPRSNQSIKPMLDLLYTYAILYIAYHGRKICICFGNEYITLKEIANLLEGKLRGIIVHFGSCSTLNTTQTNITNFITRTECSFISGYKKDVEYIDSTAFELVYFYIIQKYDSSKKIKSVITKRYFTIMNKIHFNVL